MIDPKKVPIEAKDTLELLEKRFTSSSITD